MPISFEIALILKHDLSKFFIFLIQSTFVSIINDKLVACII